jgi:hypothetical protein
MFSLIIDYWIDNGIYSAFIMIIINLITDKSRLLQNYNKTLTKRTVFPIILEWNPDQDLHEKKIRIFYAPPAKIEKNVRKLREQIRYVPRFSRRL